MKRWITIHRHTPKPSASLMRSPGVSYTDAKVSLWGLLTRTVTTTSAPINSARRAIPNTRSPSGMLDVGAPTLGGPSCCGLALIEWLWPIPPFPARGFMYVRSVAPPAMPATNGDKFPAWRGVAEHHAVACIKSNLIKRGRSRVARRHRAFHCGRARPPTSGRGGTSALCVPDRRPGRSVWTPLIAASDRRGLVDDFAHRRGALFGSFQVFKDYRQRGRPAVLLDREPGAGNEARPDVDVLYLPHPPNHSIAPTSRPDSRLGRLRRSSSAVRDLERLASRPWIEAEAMGVVSNVAALTEPGTMWIAGRWVDHRNLKLASLTAFDQMR